MAYKGPDISVWQGNIDIKTLAKQVDFFIFRSHAGSSKDSKVDRNVKLAIEAGKPYGLYIYSYALNVAQAKEEAERVVKLANTYSVKPSFLCIDMEDADGYKKACGMPSNSVLVNICKKECEVFENAGYKGLVYANSNWFNTKLKNLSGCEKWVAHWPVNSDGSQKGNATSPNGENANNCAIWQFTSQGKLNGYSGRLDMNYAYKDFVVKKETNKTESTTSSKEESSTTSYTTYTVAKGDCLSTIAAKYGVAWKDIASLNNISSPYIIYTGQKLKIPATSTNTTSSNSSSSTLKHKVGETVSFNGIYTSSTSTTKLTPAVKSGKITKIIAGARNPYLIGTNTGWVNDDVITSSKTSSSTIKSGDKVKVLNAIQYNGQAFTKYYDSYDVIEVSGDRVVIGKGKTVTCAINIKNIQKI